MTYANQRNHTATPRTGLGKLWANFTAALKATSEASVRIAYDKPWLRDRHA